MKIINKKQQKLLENLINNDPNFKIKSNIRAIDEQVKKSIKRSILAAPPTIQERILFRH